MPYTKSGIFYTAKPAPVPGIVSRRAAYQANRPAPRFGGTRKGYSVVARTTGVYGKGETKYFDTEKTSTAIAASTDWTNTEYDPATLNTLFCPQKGSGINQRIARSVKVHKIRIRGMVNIPAQANITAADGASYIRLALVQDNQTNATQAQGEQVFQDPSAASAFNASLSFQSLDNLGRFQVLKDKTIVMQNPNTSYDGTNMEAHGLARP